MKIKLTVEVQWEPDSSSYRKGTTPEQMAKFEQEALLEDPSLLMWLAEQGTMFTVKGEVLP